MLQMHLMEIEPIPTEPTLPFLRMNEKHVRSFDVEDKEAKNLYKRTFIKMRKDDFEAGHFKKDACIIDANCWKFPIRDVISFGKSYNFWDIFWFENNVKVKYLYDMPIKLTFEEARSEIVELICSNRLLNKPRQGSEKQEKFRERMALCENMHDLLIGRRIYDKELNKRFHWIGGITTYGEWFG